MKTLASSLPATFLRCWRDGLRTLCGIGLAIAGLGVIAQPSAMPDLMYKSENQAANQLGWRGYTLTNQVAADAGYWQYWWSAQRRECLRVAVNQDQVTQVIAAQPGDCPQHGGSMAPPVAGGGGASLSHLVNQPEQMVARELPRRGYALSNSSPAGAGYWQYWWNAQRGECLRVAVNQGLVTQLIATRPADCPQRGGTTAPPVAGGGDSLQSDLVNQTEQVVARELPRRGYALSNSVPARGGYWQYWWSGARGQCLRVAVNQGRVTQIVAAQPAECPRRDAVVAPVVPGEMRPPADLLNQPVGTAERAMPQRGYVRVSNVNAPGGGYWQLWWHEQGELCVRLAVNNGRITQVAPRDRAQCQR